MSFTKTKPFFAIKLLLFLVFTFVSVFSYYVGEGYAATQIQLQINNCNLNSICEPALGENYQGCSMDCQPQPPATTTLPTSTGNNGSSRSSASFGGIRRGNISNSNSPAAIFNLNIIPTTNSVLISWKTSAISRGTLLWGKTSEYESGTIAEISYDTNHEIKLANLTPAIRYYFRIESLSQTGNGTISSSEFFTLPLPDNTPPSNVTAIKIELKNDQLHFDWINPEDEDFENVKLVRSEKFYPLDPSEGKNIYEGRQQSTTDLETLNAKEFFYTIFAKDKNGNYSSGAIVHVMFESDNEHSLPQKPRASLRATGNLFDLIITQKGTEISSTEDLISVQINEPVTLTVIKEYTSSDAEHFLLSIEDPTKPGTFNSFLMRSLTNKGTHEATISKFKIPGTFAFFVTYLDGKKKPVAQIRGNINVVESDENLKKSFWSKFKLGISILALWIKVFFSFN